MIWPDWKIREWAEAGGLTPYNPDNVNPASVDLCFSGRAKLATAFGTWQDWEGSDGLLQIEPGELWLLDTVEYVRMPMNAGGSLMLKSSMGRMGLEHLHAGWFDPGFEGTATLEMVNVNTVPLVIEKGQRIVQLVFQQLMGRPDRGYQSTGRYVGQRGPTEARGVVDGYFDRLVDRVARLVVR